MAIIEFPELWNDIKEEEFEKIEGQEKCKKCNGNGEEEFSITFTLKKPCERCMGTGKVYWTENITQKKMTHFDFIQHLLRDTNKWVKFHKSNIRKLIEYIDCFCNYLGYEVQLKIVPITFASFVRKPPLKDFSEVKEMPIIDRLRFWADRKNWDIIQDNDVNALIESLTETTNELERMITRREKIND